MPRLVKVQPRRAVALGGMLVLVTSAITLLPLSPASAAVHCNSNGTPNWSSGKFVNNTGGTVMVKGDALVNGAFKTVERAVGKEGGTAAAAGICDADYVKMYVDYIYNGSQLMDGDVYNRVAGATTTYCYNFSGSPVNTACDD